MINFYSRDILVVFFLGRVIYILAIKLTLLEQITMIEQVAVQETLGEFTTSKMGLSHFSFCSRFQGFQGLKSAYFESSA